MRVPVGMVQPWSSRCSATAAVSRRRRHMFFPSGCFHSCPYTSSPSKKKKKTFQHVPSLITLTKTLTKTNVAGESYKNEHDSCKIYYFDVSKLWSDLIKRNGSLATTMSENTQKYISIWKFVSINKPTWTSTELGKHHTIFILIYYLYVII